MPDHVAAPAVPVLDEAAIKAAAAPEAVPEAEAAPLATQRADSDDDMPLPGNARTVFLGGLFFLAALAALYVASAIVLPVVLAFVLKLLLQPIVRTLEGLRLPRAVGAVVALVLVLGVLAGIGTLISGPAASWAGKLPEAIPRLMSQVHFLDRPIAAIQRALDQMQGLAGMGDGGSPPPAQAGGALRPMGILSSLFAGTTAAMASLFTTLIVLFYLLVFGEIFLRRMVEILPRFRDKRQAVEISLHLERDLSAYLLTITAINAAVGVATGITFWACGMSDPVLWGATAFVLNYVPILGPMCGLVLFAAVGVLSRGVSWWALLPVALYFCIHVAEGEVITPMLLARRFTINPVAVVLALVFWYWMWGVPGAVLAVPLLAVIKIICDRLRPLRAFGHFLEG